MIKGITTLNIWNTLYMECRKSSSPLGETGAERPARQGATTIRAAGPGRACKRTCSERRCSLCLVQ